MPELKCTVQTCMHNQDFLCRLDSIQVGGSQAKASKETCCDSFEERKHRGWKIPIRTHMEIMRQRLRIVAELIVKQLTACTMNSVNVKRERSAWKVPVRVIRTAQSAPHFSADKK